jgi:hypothetical protein
MLLYTSFEERKDFFNYEKIRDKERKDGILDYAISVKVNER